MLPSDHPKNVLSTLKALYYIMMAPLVFIAVFFVAFPIVRMPELHETMRITVPLVSLAVLFLSRWISGRRMKALSATATLVEKVRTYQVSKLLRMAALEGAATLNIVIFGLTGNLFYLGFLAVLIFIYALERPTISSMAIEIPLTPDEQRRIEDGTIES